MAPRQPPLFLARRSYRRRRLGDGARLLPVLGVILWLMPMLWGGPGDATTPTARAMLWIFGVWAGLILLTAVVSRRLSRHESAGQDEGAGTGAGPGDRMRPDPAEGKPR